MVEPKELGRFAFILPLSLTSSLLSRNRLLEDGVDLSALLHPQEEPATRLSLSIPRGSVGGGEGEEAAAASSSSPSSGRGHRQDGTRGAAPQAEVIQLCEQAKRALIGRAVTLMTVYFLPVIILYFWLAAYKVGRCDLRVVRGTASIQLA